MSEKSFETRNVNGGSTAAALGLAVAVDDIENVGNEYDTNSNNTTSSDNDTFTKTVSDNDVEDSNNQDNDIVTRNDNDTFTKTISDNDTITRDSNNQDNDTFTKTVSLSDNDVEDSNNQDNDIITRDSNNSTEITTSVDVAISDAFKKINDSYNSDSDDDWLELDNLDFDVLTAIGDGTLAGEGNDTLFNISQVSEITDNDTLHNPQVNSSAGWDQELHGQGGEAHGGGDFGERGTGTAKADGVAQMEAFTQNIVMGANIQYNGVDISVVGGNSSVTDGGDIS